MRTLSRITVLLVACTVLVFAVGDAAHASRIQRFPLPLPHSLPCDITTDGGVIPRFTAYGAMQIGRVTPRCELTEFPIPTSNGSPVGITEGPDGNLWFTEQLGNRIGRITSAGALSEFPVPT